MSELLKILYDSKANITSNIAKNGIHYLRVDFGKIITDPQKSKSGTTCMLVFANEHNIKLLNYKYLYYKNTGLPKATNKKEYERKEAIWNKLPFKKAKVPSDVMLIKRTKSGSFIYTQRLSCRFAKDKKNKQIYRTRPKTGLKSFIDSNVNSIRNTQHQNTSIIEMIEVNTFDFSTFQQAIKRSNQELEFIYKYITKFIDEHKERLTYKQRSKS